MEFINYAHRGASAYVPENTMAAFARGIQMGANGIELDLQETRDGEIVIFHDDTIDKKSDGSGRIADHTLAELKAMDFGRWFGEPFAGTRIAEFGEFLSVYGHGPIHLAVELKVTGIAKKALSMIRRYRPGYENVRITSFLYEALGEVREADPLAKTGWLVGEADADTLARLREIGGTQVCPDAAKATEEAVRTAHEEGFEVRLWGVKDAVLMKKGVEIGADGMTVNFPDLLAAYLAEVRHGL